MLGCVDVFMEDCGKLVIFDAKLLLLFFRWKLRREILNSIMVMYFQENKLFKWGK